ncbi:PSME3-interacting protein isoform X1 [Lepisosteus oculatus]|uniref:PSME3-interacting protein isoform X1 n=1 Tax=Lepisosteus oculatus TaxID=7918 RepID=UPI0035F51319
MAEAGDQNLFIGRKFVSEAELDEQRKRRQEEWEKVRKPDDPEECPEEEYDPRSLYERLQEQKEKKQEEYEEQFKFKNMVKGLDEDETHFLDEVSRQQLLLERQRREEDMKELKEYRSALAKLPADSESRKDEKKAVSKPADSKSSFSQARLLAGAVKRRSSDPSDTAKKQRLETEELGSEPEKQRGERAAREAGGGGGGGGRGAVVHRPAAAVCVGILPGLGAYSGSSDSESSSDSEEIM